MRAAPRSASTVATRKEQSESPRLEWAHRNPDAIDKARYIEALGLRLNDIFNEEIFGEEILNEYASEHGLSAPLDISSVDLVKLFSEKPLALHASRARKELHRLIDDALDIDSGAPYVFFAPGEYDDKGEGRPPHLFISPDLAERFPFKSRTLKKALRRVPKADPTPSTAAFRKLKKVLEGIALSRAFTPIKAINEKKILAEFSAWLRDERERRRRMEGSQKVADVRIAHDLGCPSETVRSLARPKKTVH